MIQENHMLMSVLSFDPTSLRCFPLMNAKCFSNKPYGHVAATELLNAHFVLHRDLRTLSKLTYTLNEKETSGIWEGIIVREDCSKNLIFTGQFEAKKIRKK